LEAGQTSALLVQLECVGPAGSSTPAMTAKVQADLGLSAASGSIDIPAMTAGSGTIVRIPKVVAGGDPTGLFRLALNVEGPNSRRIVLEGRIGMSRITGGLLPKLQMILSHDGKALISGRPGKSMQFDTATLLWQPLAMSGGYGIVGAEYSPSGSRLAMVVQSVEAQKTGFVIVDPKTGVVQNLPTGARFLRWLADDEVLVAMGERLVLHPLTGAEDRTLGDIEGCPKVAAGSVIAGTDIVYVMTPEGKTCIQRGKQAPQEVMAGVNAPNFGAVANDLSLFGGVDAEKRLWVQHGVDAQPEMVASGVAQVLWGPISRRALVLDAAKKGRVYDGRTRKWIDLGVIEGAQWSADEENLVFVEAADGGYLSELIGDRVERVASMNRIGAVKALAFPSGDKVFMLAAVAGGMDVWMVALPSSSPAK